MTVHENDLRRCRRDRDDIFQAISDCVFILDADHTILEVNRAAVEKTGRTAEELVGRKCYEIFHGTDQSPADCPFPTMITSKTQVFGSMEVEALGGTFLISCTPQFDDEGNIDRIIHIVTDITVAKKTEMAMMASENLLRTYFVNAPIGMAIVGLDDRIQQANNALCQMLGYSREILLTKTVSDITHPDDIEKEFKHGHKKGAGKNFQLEKRYLHADSHIIWGQLSVYLMKDSKGTPLYYLGQVQDITAHKQSEQDLLRALEEAQKERTRADAILAAIGDPITIQDTNFRIIYQNEANKKALGNHLGEYCYEAYEHNTDICEGCALEKAFADGKVHKAERSVTIDNETMHFEITASPLLDKDGHPIAGIELARNITERKRNEELLAEQVRLLSLSSDVGNVLTKASTVRGMLTECGELLVQHLDAAFARVWTVDDTGEVLILQASAGLYTHIDGPHGRIPINEKTKIGAIGSTRMEHTTNTVIGDPGVTNQEWAIKEGMVAFAGHPLLIEGRLIGVIGMFFNHTLSESTSRAIVSIADEMALGIERLRSEDRLKRSNRALRILSKCNEALVKTSTEQELLEKVCALIVEPEGYLMAWVGYAEDDAAKTVRIMAQVGFDEGYLDAIQVSWEDSETGRGPTGTAIRTGEICSIKDIQTDPKFSLWKTAAKQRGYMSCIALPLSDSTSKTFGALNIYSSEPNAFDKEEIKLLSELAGDLSFGINGIRMRDERMQDMLEKQKLESRLRQAQKLEVIGTLAGGIAHDFNNILSAVLGYTELAREEIGPQSKAGQDLLRVMTAGKRAADLVSQILAISRQSEKELQPVKIHYIINEVLRLLRPSISTFIQIKSKIDKECPPVIADPSEIHQVIMNLCTNANYAMREIERSDHVLEIQLVPVELNEPIVLNLGLNLSPGRFVKLTVSDTGGGMGAKIMARIFDPYFTTKKIGEGTGLGLATVHSIVTGSGGDITVESTIGKGTTFSVYLPVYEGDIHEKNQEEDNQIIGRGTEHILVVDDEESIVQLLQRILVKLGYQVSAFTSSEEAKRIFMEQPMTFDLVITDMNMPKIKGTDLARSFLEIRPDLPIILCTGFSEKVDIEMAKIVGIRELLHKPVKTDVLHKLMRTLLDKK